MNGPRTRQAELVYERLGMKFVRWREDNTDWNQGEFAQEMGVCPSVYNKIENGRAGVSVARIVELADKMNCDVDVMLVDRTAKEKAENFEVESQLS